MNPTLKTLAADLGLTFEGADVTYVGASIDTRILRAGGLFFALPGEHTDGHRFVAEAAKRGAAAAVVEIVQPVNLPQLVVSDVLAALVAAARQARDRFAGPVVGITGSNGKTTVKQMLAAICARSGAVLATQGNLNNELGVPLTLLGMSDQATAIIEMGAAKAGDVAQLAEIARPTIGLVTNAGRAHLAGFGSRDGVAHAKGEMFAGLAADGVAVINADDRYADLWRGLAGDRRRVEFGFDNADVSAVNISRDAAKNSFDLVTPAGAARVQLGLAGEHNIANALAAAAVAHALGVEPAAVAAGLSETEAAVGRLEPIATQGGARLVDDSYNANPDSLAAGLAWLAEQPGPRWLVLGDMAELGGDAAVAHESAGASARQAGIDRLWSTGELAVEASRAFDGGSDHYSSLGALANALTEALADVGTAPVVLIKGSRSAGMDRIARRLADAVPRTSGATC